MSSCWRIHFTLFAGKKPYLHTEPRGEKLSCVLYAVRGRSTTNQRKTLPGQTRRLQSMLQIDFLFFTELKNCFYFELVFGWMYAIFCNVINRPKNLTIE